MAGIEGKGSAGAWQGIAVFCPYRQGVRDVLVPGHMLLILEGGEEA